MKERSSPSGMHNDLTAWTEEQIMGLEVDFIHIASAEFLSAFLYDIFFTGFDLVYHLSLST